MLDAFLKGEMVLNQVANQFPAEGYVFDYAFNFEEGTWVPWMDTITPYQYNSKAEFSELIIPTLDSVRCTYLFDLLVSHKKHVLMVGDTGTGKTI